MQTIKYIENIDDVIILQNNHVLIFVFLPFEYFDQSMFDSKKKLMERKLILQTEKIKTQNKCIALS